ncbi:MAG: hypothetical protein ACREQL_14560, partial [Candidatus Binatia bacterium]
PRACHLSGRDGAMRSTVSIARTAFAVAVGFSFAALAADAARGAGPVVGWGLGSIPKITATAIAAGGDHSCAIQARRFAVSAR